jgi:hypothetical protein
MTSPSANQKLKDENMPLSLSANNPSEMAEIVPRNPEKDLLEFVETSKHY